MDFIESIRITVDTINDFLKKQQKVVLDIRPILLDDSIDIKKWLAGIKKEIKTVNISLLDAKLTAWH